MNFSAWSIKNPIPAILLFGLLTLAGLMAFRSAKVQDFPDIELPAVTVTANLPGASPSQLETEVTRKIEDSIASIGDVKHITSTVTDGSSSTTVEFVLEKDVAEAVNDVRDAVSRIRTDLPTDLEEPIVAKITLSGLPILRYTVQAKAEASGAMDELQLSWLVDNAVAKRLLAVPGVGQVARIGGLDREVRVELDPALLAALNVTAADISSTLRQVQLESSGGRTDVGGLEQSVRTLGTVRTAEEVAAIEIALSSSGADVAETGNAQAGRRIRLSDVATVVDTGAERRSLALLDGKPAVAFEITRSKGASEIDVGSAVRRAVEALSAEHPNVLFTEATEAVTPVSDNYEGSMHLLYEGAALAVLVVWLFLRDWRATFVSAVALPLSIIPTFLAMKWFGFTLNTVTLLSLSLVVGILVDDAIVEVENIVRHLRMGKPPLQAALEAADEIGLAVIATTFALIAVFLPTAFMDGIAGKFFKQFGWTAALAVFFSLVVARLITPMMAAYILKPLPAKEHDGWLMQRYLKAVRWCLGHRGLTALGAGLFFVGSIALVPLLPTGFIPPADRSLTAASIELAPGSTLAETQATAEQARALIVQSPEVQSVFTAIGSAQMGGGPGGGMGSVGEVRRAQLFVRVVPRGDRATSQQDVEAALRDRLAGIAGARITVGSGDSGEQLMLVLTGDEPRSLTQAALAIERELRTLPGIGNVSSTASLLRPEVVVRPDFARAADLGVTVQGIGETLRVATSGDYDAQLAKLNLDERQVPIRVRLPDAARADLATIERLAVPSRNGHVMLGAVASVQLDSGPAQIDRYDRSRNVTLSLELNGRPLGDVAKEVDALPALQALPAGVKRQASGDLESQQELFGSFGLAMLTGVLCVYVVLVLLFKDFAQPLTILAALPLSLGGAFIALLVTRNAFSMPSLIGLLMLMGIVAKNSILLVEYAVMQRVQQGMSRFDALMDACHKRAQPILMTTIAMAAGMLPIALGIGADPSFRAPMAVAVIGGLLTSTLLSLLVIPVVYTFVDDAENGLARLWRRGKPDKSREPNELHRPPTPGSVAPTTVR